MTDKGIVDKFGLSQLKLITDAAAGLNEKLLFLKLIDTDEYLVSRVMNLKDGSYQQGDFTLRVYSHMYSSKVLWLINHKKQFYFYWMCSNFYRKPLNIPHEVYWILNNFKFGSCK